MGHGQGGVRDSCWGSDCWLHSQVSAMEAACTPTSVRWIKIPQMCQPEGLHSLPGNRPRSCLLWTHRQELRKLFRPTLPILGLPALPSCSR